MNSSETQSTYSGLFFAFHSFQMYSKIKNNPSVIICFEEWKKYLDWGAKHRYNVLDQQEKFVTGFVQPFIWRRLGVQTELTDWQKEQIDLRQKMFDYARMLDMKIQVENRLKKALKRFLLWCCMQLKKTYNIV